ncbi:c-type cytochrome [Oxalobacteraceae bacterium OM1]|nr:c-type cytochrome [Oxalobacteraceae bacterium OM1]
MNATTATLQRLATRFGIGLLFAWPVLVSAAGGDAELGRRAIERYACVACHRIPGIPGPPSDVGPPLDHMARRAYIAGVLGNTPANMERWLRDPPAVDPRTAMPNLQLSEREARDVAAYLATLR